MACVTVDKIGKNALEDKSAQEQETAKYLYKYKGIVDIPPLSMVDDLLTIQECGLKSLETNAYINTCI